MCVLNAMTNYETKMILLTYLVDLMAFNNIDGKFYKTKFWTDTD